MTTPLNDPSGSGFYGKGYWGRKVYWLNVPSQWRRLDEYNYLQMLLNTWGDLGEDLLGQIALLPRQRDPYVVRAKDTWTRWFYVTEAFNYEDSDKGSVIRLIGEKDFTEMPGTDEDDPPSDDASIMTEWFPWFPYSPLAEVGRWWQVSWKNAQYEVINVRSRNYDQPSDADGTPIYNANTSLSNEVWVQGGDLTLLFDYFSDRLWSINEEDNVLQGTVVAGTTDGSQRPVVRLPTAPLRLTPNIDQVGGLAASSRVVVRIPLEGGGERLLYDYPVDDLTGTLRSASGDPLTLDATVGGTVNYLSGEITVDLEPFSEFSLITGTDDEIAMRVKYLVRGYFFQFNAPPNIDYLAQDYGFQNDHNDPVDVQRSSIANVTKFWGLKSTAKSYAIRGAISLFDVEMQGLYRVGSVALATQIPVEHVFVIDGTIYTDVRPIYVRYDHVASDEHFYDWKENGVGSEWITVIDHMLVAEDSSRWDGMTVGQAYSIDVTQGYYGLISPFNSNVRGSAQVLPASSDPSGEVGVVQMSQEELEARRWQNGYKYQIRMKRCQYEAFNFHEDPSDPGMQKPELFALSVYDYSAAGPQWGTPPHVDDDYYYIDEQIATWVLESQPTSDPKEDIGRWEVAIQFGLGVSSPINNEDDVAVRYFPTFDSMDCSYCRSNRMRALVGATEEAYEFYDTAEKVDSAIIRLKTKLDALVPIHASVIEYEVTRRIEHEMFGAQNGASVVHETEGTRFVGNTSVLLSVYLRGDMNTAGKAVDLSVESEDTGVVWSDTLQTSASDNDTWEQVVSDVSITLPDEAGPGDVPWRVWLKADASATAVYGDVRFVMTVTRKES